MGKVRGSIKKPGTIVKTVPGCISVNVLLWPPIGSVIFQTSFPLARSIPIESLQQRLAELPGDVEVVAYCRGPFCVYADDAVRQLSAGGRRARRLEDGFPQWKQAGLPATAGSR